MSSRAGKPRIVIPKNTAPVVEGVDMSPIRVDEDLLPTATFVVRLTRLNQGAGWLAGEFSLEEMWRMVDRIRIGEHGYAMVIAPGGELIAHGDPDKKALVAQARTMTAHPLVAAIRDKHDEAPASLEYTDDGRKNLGVATKIPALGWTVAVEQPTSEAYANATQLERQLRIAILAALLVMVIVGYLFGRSFINPILELKRATHDVAAGRLSTRVDITTGDEFTDLGESFNTMADRLVQLQEDVKRQERHAMFGRVAAGIVHDLSHPIQNIGNSTRLLLRDDVDQESRDMFRRTIERELTTLKRFMDDLRNVVKPKPIERFAMEVNQSVTEIVESMRPEGDRNGVLVEARYAPGPLVIEGDRFALGRVYRNLMSNAIQATAPGGSVTIATARVGDHVEISVTDTGIGHSRRSSVRDLRRLRHNQAAGPRARPRNLQAHRRATRWHDRRRERGRARHGVHTAVSRARRSDGPGGCKLEGGMDMFRTLVKTDALSVADQTVAVRYFELRTMRGARRYSAEILLAPGDRIILDDDSVTNLEARTNVLVPATLYSRLLASRPDAA